MKKVLYLSLVTYSIFSMQLDTFKSNYSKIKVIRQKLDYVKQHCSKSPVHDVSSVALTKEGSFSGGGNDSIDSIKQPIEPSSFFASKGLGEIKLFHNEKGFHVLHNDKMHYVQPCFTDPIVRKATPLKIKEFQKVNKGYFAINQMGDGQFELKVMDRVRGGGPILGKIAYWTTKVICYGVITAATIAAITQGTTPDKVIPSSGQDMAMNTLKGMGEGALRQVSLDHVDNAVKAGVGYVAANVTVPLAQAVGSTAGKDVMITVGKETMARVISTAPSGLPVPAALGINTVSGAIIGGGFQEEAKALVAVSVATTSGSGFGIAASIESLALSIGLFFGMTPTP